MENAMENAMENENNVVIDVGGWATASGAQSVSIILAPPGEHGRGEDTILVYSWNTIGSGVPEQLYHGRHRLIGDVPISADPDALDEALRDELDAIRRIAALYQGTTWSGRNHVGSWADDGDGCGDPDLLDLSHVACRTDAAEWFAGASREVVSNAILLARDGMTLEQIAAAEEHGAAPEVLLEGAEDAIRDLLTDRLAELRRDLAADGDADASDAITIATLLGEDPEPLRWGLDEVEGVIVRYPRGSFEAVSELFAAADEGGTIQAEDMVGAFPGRPELHTATSLDRALALLDARIERD